MYLCCWVRSKLQKAVDLFVLLGCKKNECSSSAWQTANLNEFYVQQQPAATLAASDFPCLTLMETVVGGVVRYEEDRKENSGVNTLRLLIYFCCWVRSRMNVVQGLILFAWQTEN